MLSYFLYINTVVCVAKNPPFNTPVVKLATG